MNPEKLAELAERCEQASGPDNEIDVDIVLDVLWDGQGHEPAQLAFTRSLDAAMSLVPEGEFICVDGPRKYLNIPTPVPNYWRACIGTQIRAWAATPALALVAASLRSLASRGGTEG